MWYMQDDKPHRRQVLFQTWWKIRHDKVAGGKKQLSGSAGFRESKQPIKPAPRHWVPPIRNPHVDKKKKDDGGRNRKEIQKTTTKKDYDNESYTTDDENDYDKEESDDTAEGMKTTRIVILRHWYKQ